MKKCLLDNVKGIVASLVDYALAHYAISNDYGYTLTAETGYRLDPRS